jgi:hypothetical protein
MNVRVYLLRYLYSREKYTSSYITWCNMSNEKVNLFFKIYIKYLRYQYYHTSVIYVTNDTELLHLIQTHMRNLCIYFLLSALGWYFRILIRTTKYTEEIFTFYNTI